MLRRRLPRSSSNLAAPWNGRGRATRREMCAASADAIACRSSRSTRRAATTRSSSMAAASPWTPQVKLLPGPLLRRRPDLSSTHDGTGDIRPPVSPRTPPLRSPRPRYARLHPQVRLLEGPPRALRRHRFGSRRRHRRRSRRPENVIGVGMPGPFSSTGSMNNSRNSPKTSASASNSSPSKRAFGLRHALEPLFTGTPPDPAEENLQSRIRGVVLMALSNKFGALVLTTGNKTELAVGYCTLYGDMYGALAVIGDCSRPKSTRAAAASTAPRDHPADPGGRPPPNCARPARPGSLPPYDILDPILAAYVERDADPRMHRRRERRRAGHGQGRPQQNSKLSEYKRRQAAPASRSPRALSAWAAASPLPSRSRSKAIRFSRLPEIRGLNVSQVVTP